MSNKVFYDVTIAMFTRSLNQLHDFLRIGEKWALDNSVPAEKLIRAQLAPDMHGLPFQVYCASDTSVQLLGGIGGDFPIKDKLDGLTFADLHGYVDKALAKLAEVTPESWEGMENKPSIARRLGKDFDTKTVPFMQIHCIPNFYFHVATAYDILRHEGVPLGKKDYLGNRDGLFSPCKN